MKLEEGLKELPGHPSSPLVPVLPVARGRKSILKKRTLSWERLIMQNSNFGAIAVAAAESVLGVLTRRSVSGSRACSLFWTNAVTRSTDGSFWLLLPDRISESPSRDGC